MQATDRVTYLLSTIAFDAIFDLCDLWDF